MYVAIPLIILLAGGRTRSVGSTDLTCCNNKRMKYNWYRQKNQACNLIISTTNPPARPYAVSPRYAKLNAVCDFYTLCLSPTNLLQAARCTNHCGIKKEGNDCYLVTHSRTVHIFCPKGASARGVNGTKSSTGYMRRVERTLLHVHNY